MNNKTFTEKDMDRLLIIKSVNGGDIRQKDAAIQLKLTTRQVRRLQTRIRQEGIFGVKRKASGGNRAFRPEFKKQVLALMHEHYRDFGPTFASEKLLERDNFRVNKETLRQWMIEEKLWIPKSRRQARIHQSRERRPRFGELIQWDGSHHDWFEGRGPKCCLLVLIDDATSQIVHMHFEENETTLGYFRCIFNSLQVTGRPLAYYSDRHSIFRTSRPNTAQQNFEDTQFERALTEINIELICAKSPQAKGRVERANKTMQDRLIKEMRLSGISTIEQANRFLPDFIAGHNKKFAVSPFIDEDAHLPLYYDKDKLEQILSIQETRKLSKNLECHFECNTLQVQNVGNGYRYRGAKVKVCKLINGHLKLLHGNKSLTFKTIKKHKPQMTVENRKELEALMRNVWRYPQGPQPSASATF